MKRIATYIFCLTFICLPFSIEAQRILYDGGMKVAWMNPSKDLITPQYEKTEFGVRPVDSIQFNLAVRDKQKDAINPFDPEQLLITAHFVHFKNGEFKKREGFYYEDYTIKKNDWGLLRARYPFRIRFSPPLAGQWKMVVHFQMNGKLMERSDTISFYVKNGTDKGFVQKGESGEIKDRYLHFSKDSSTFFAVGENLGWADYDYLRPSSTDQLMNWMSELAQAGGNYFRVWMRAPAYGIEQELLGHYGQRMTNAWDLDRIFDYADQLGLYIQLHLVNDEFTPEDGWPQSTLWKNNPYNKELGLGEVKLFYQDPRALEFLKRRFRYIEARWGYSTNLAVYEIVSEPDIGSNYEHSPDRKKFFNWANALHHFLKDSLQTEHLTTISFMREEPNMKLDAWRAMDLDIASVNQYGRHIAENFKVRYNIPTKIHSKRAFKDMPFIFSEMGVATFPTLEYCSDISFHNAIWGTAMNGSYGCGLNWWWDNALHKQGYQSNLKALARFMKDEEMSKKDYKADRGHDALFHKNSDIAYIGLKRTDKVRMIAWVKNNAHWWPRLYAQNDCIKNAVDDPKTRVDKADDTDYRYRMDEEDFRPLESLDGARFKIRGLQSWGQYKVDWYSTTGDGGRIKPLSTTVKANIFGTVKLDFPQSETYQEFDYGVKLEIIE